MAQILGRVLSNVDSPRKEPEVMQSTFLRKQRLMGYRINAMGEAGIPTLPKFIRVRSVRTTSSEKEEFMKECQEATKEAEVELEKETTPVAPIPSLSMSLSPKPKNRRSKLRKSLGSKLPNRKRKNTVV